MFTIGMLVPVWALYTGIREPAGVPALGFLFILHFIGSFVFWVLGAAVLSFVAELAGGRGTAVGLFLCARLCSYTEGSCDAAVGDRRLTA